MYGKNILWDSPLAKVARGRKKTPEAWHGRVLADEVHDLQIMTRSLEFQLGFLNGRTIGRVEGALATKLNDEEPGAAVVAVNPGA